MISVTFGSEQFSVSHPFFSRDSDLTTSVVRSGCGNVKSGVWLCAKRRGYVSSKP